MTTLSDIQRIFSVRGINPDRISQSPADSAFVLATACGGYVRFAPVEDGTTRSGWAYTAHNPLGEQTEQGGCTSTAPEALLPALRPLLDPPELTYLPDRASTAQLQALRGLGHPGEHRPFALHPDSPAGRWILALFVAWLDLADTDTGGDAAGDAPINGGDLVTALGQGFAAIGLSEDLSLHELAVRIDRGRAAAGEHPAVGLIETCLDTEREDRGGDDAGDVAAGNRDLARAIAEALRCDNQLVTYRSPGQRADGPDNEDRAGWAEAALDAVIARTGDARSCYRDPDSLWEAGGDLVANLMHLADRAGLDPQLLLEAGHERHRTEHVCSHDARTCSIPGCRLCEIAA